MSHSVTPSAEPIAVTIGDTLAWTKLAPLDHLASDGWTLSYALQLPGSTEAPITFSATTDGDNYAVAITASTTAAWDPPGNYVWYSFLTKASARYQHETGSIRLLANPAATPNDSHAVRALAMIELAIEGRLPRGLESYSIQGQQIVKITLTRLYELRNYYSGLVANEKAQANLDAGLSNSSQHFARFKTVR